jgi:hypothetical protein
LENLADTPETCRPRPYDFCPGRSGKSLEIESLNHRVIEALQTISAGGGVSNDSNRSMIQ